jgi:hypothetical protein
MQGDFQPLAPFGVYYGESLFVPRMGEAPFAPLINRTPEEATRARQEPLPPNLETYAAALTRDEIDETIVMEWSPFMVNDTDRGGWIMAMVKDHKIAKHTPNAMLLYPSLDDHCPRCTQIHDAGHRRFSAATCEVLRKGGPPVGFKACDYLYCSMLPAHAKVFCSKINLRCFHCLHRGHAEGDGVCRDVDVNLTIFEEAAATGFVTKNRFRPEGAGSGYYPVITLSQVRHIDSVGATPGCWPSRLRRRRT